MNHSITRLLQIMAQLRDPQTGCPWDCEQTFSSIIPHTIEETYEVVDCIERENYSDLKDELGDLLFQVVFLSRIAEEQGLFSFDDVANAISDKLVRRHPHVFSDMSIESPEQLASVWESIKQQERAEKTSAGDLVDSSMVATVEAAHPALIHATKLQKAVAKVGFDWPSAEGVISKLEEELAELKQEMSRAIPSEDALTHEMGDVFFAAVNLSRHLKLSAETVLRKTNYRFERRFRCMEDIIKKNGQNINELSVDAMELYWQQAKSVVG